MKRVFNYLSLCFIFFATSVNAIDDNEIDKRELFAKKIKSEININGIADDASWQLATWQPIDKLILGDMPDESDFSGRFKVMWDERQLYLLVEITDDILFDQHADPRYLYWDDDCLEIFIDEDASGGNHQFNYNAFAYHVALDNQAVDIGEKQAGGSDNFVLLNDHIQSVWMRNEKAPNKIVWEVAVKVYDDSFTLDTSDKVAKNTKLSNPVSLTLGKELGFMLAYCDNDGSKEREHFMGSVDIKSRNGSKNLGYITADVFQKMTLVK